MHRIHHYPAKFKHFIISKSLKYAEDKGLNPVLLGDIFCGCGTTALEAKRRNIGFWGCDINPVATLITRVKSQQFNDKRVEKYYGAIVKSYLSEKETELEGFPINSRIEYWFDKPQITKLYYLKRAIEKCVPKGKYRDFFLVAFSNILKSTSRWLSKSIKPQIDPIKKPQDILRAFEKQIKMMRKANLESIFDYRSSSETAIVTANVLIPNKNWPKLDMIITSPPYVTSYDYADLHQLSSLWLNYTDDYRKLRRGSIGTKQCKINLAMVNTINEIGKKMVTDLKNKDASTAESVAKYFVDINKAIRIAYNQLNEKGTAFIVIGNTKYHDVKIDNAKFIALSMLEQGFVNVDVIKRKISSKILTSYRDEVGKFSALAGKNVVYSYEYIVVGQKGAYLNGPRKCWERDR